MLPKKVRYKIQPALNVIHSELEILKSPKRWRRFKWERIEDTGVERVEAACVQFGHRLYVMGGYRSLDEVLSLMEVLDLNTGRWIERLEMPEFIAQTHCGIVGEAQRYIYFITGQVGIQCAPAVVDAHVYDTKEKRWGVLPPLPEVRYAPVTRLWNGRIHVMAGSKHDRVTPATEHWSLAVKDGQARETSWRPEPSIPLGGPHRSSGAIGDTLYVLGSQYYDRPPKPGDPRYVCDWSAREEIFFKNCYSLKRGDSDWRRCADMPVAVTHSEYCTFVAGEKIVLLGGLTDRRMLTDVIQEYDTAADAWRIIGRLPWRNKGSVYGYHDGWLTVLLGQKQISRFNASFGPVLKEGYKTRF